MSAAEALPPVSPWRDTSKLTGIPTDAELASAEAFDPAARASHNANVATLVTQAAWRPANVEEDDFLDALYQAHVDQAFIERAEHARDWPPAGTEPEAWS